MAVQKEAAARTKVVVRGLPPTLDAAEVQAAIDALCAGKYDWFTFVPGKVRCVSAAAQRAAMHSMPCAKGCMSACTGVICEGSIARGQRAMQGLLNRCAVLDQSGLINQRCPLQGSPCIILG